MVVRQVVEDQCVDLSSTKKARVAYQYYCSEVTQMTLFFPIVVNFKSSCALLRGGADKSLARSGRKQATATKLGIYSTYPS
jgi:hypothetical protein